jgi:uncharacterized protein
MKILIALNHPAHYYLFKFTSLKLRDNGHEVRFVIKGKDILEKLLVGEGVDYTILMQQRKMKGSTLSFFFTLASEMINHDRSLFRYLKTFNPDIMLGTDIAISQAGFFKCIPSIVFNEDDIEINKLFCYSSYPFASQIITPEICNVGRFRGKQIKYCGYQKLAYLHPNQFSADLNVVRKYLNEEKPYFLLRLVSFSAGHDIEKKHGGFNQEIVERLISLLKQKGDVFISSEKKLPEELAEYELKIDLQDIHHLMFYSSLFIGDSQSMIVEAAMLGVPSVRFNSFVGKISVLNELEEKYLLTTGIRNDNPELMLKKVEELISMDNIRAVYQERRIKMLSEKIDVTAFMVWFVENYPESVRVMKRDPEYQLRFR